VAFDNHKVTESIGFLTCHCDGDSLRVDGCFRDVMVHKVRVCLIEFEIFFKGVRSKVMRAYVFQATRRVAPLVKRVVCWELEREKFGASAQSRVI
jgi:hypothetical protein